MKVANYQGAIGTYQCFLWDNMPTFIDALPEDKKVLAQTFQQEGLSVATQQMLSARHTVDATAKSMATSVALQHFTCLRTTGLAEDAHAHIEDLPFN